MQRHIVQTLGWYGVGVILLAYALLNFGVWSASSTWYLLCNLTGAIAIAIEAGTKRDQQPMVLNIVWALVALVAIAQLWS